jgi:hypothetical protein
MIDDPFQLFYICSLPPHFNYSRTIEVRGMVFKYRIATFGPPGHYPMTVRTYRSGYFSYLKTGVKENKAPEEGLLDPSDHETFTGKGIKHIIHSPYEMFSKESAKHQTINGHSMIVYLNPQKMIINKALESYPPKK